MCLVSIRNSEEQTTPRRLTAVVSVENEAKNEENYKNKHKRIFRVLRFKKSDLCIFSSLTLHPLILHNMAKNKLYLNFLTTVIELRVLVESICV